MKQELIVKLLEMLINSKEGKPASVESDSESTEGKELIGEFVIVRCRDAGVHAGTLVSYKGREVVLKDSRRLWYWKCANNQHSLSGVAKEGVTSESKIPAAVETAVLTEACEILSTTDKCKSSIMGAEIHVN